MGRVREALERLGLDEELLDWADTHGDDLAEAWASCPRGDWLLRIALRVGVDRRLVVRAAALCVSPTLRLLPSNEQRPALALTAAQRWCEGETNDAACFAAAFAASNAANESFGGSGSRARAAKAAACVAFACDAAADLAYYAERAYAAEALHLAASSFDQADRAHAAFTQTVRTIIPFDWVGDRVEPAIRASQMPPPPERDPLRESHVKGPSFGEESSPRMWFDPDGVA